MAVQSLAYYSLFSLQIFPLFNFLAKLSLTLDQYFFLLILFYSRIDQTQIHGLGKGTKQRKCP